MNTIKKSQILEAEKLATVYAGELRGKGFKPSKTLAVTTEKVMRLHFQNGELNRIAFPVGRLADWVKTFSGDPEINVEFEGRAGEIANQRNTIAAIFSIGGSRIKFHLCTDADTISSLCEVPPIQFDDGNHSRQDFQLLPPPELGDLKAKIASDKAARELAKLRSKEIAAKVALKKLASEHCENLNTLAGGILPAISRARLIVKSRRMLRAALAAPMDIIPWLGESVTPAGEYDAGPVTNLTPEHFDLVAAVLTQRANRDAFKASKRYRGYNSPTAIKWDTHLTIDAISVTIQETLNLHELI